MARRIFQIVCGAKADKNIGLEKGEMGFATCSDKGLYIGVDGTQAAEIRFPNQTDVQNMIAAIDIKNAGLKTMLVDADTIPLSDSAAGNTTKRITWANIKAVLTSVFAPLSHNHDTGQITTGILSEARGGTGQNSLANVNAFIKQITVTQAIFNNAALDYSWVGTAPNNITGGPVADYANMLYIKQATNGYGTQFFIPVSQTNPPRLYLRQSNGTIWGPWALYSPTYVQEAQPVNAPIGSLWAW